MMKGIINPPCYSLLATLFIIYVERKKRVKAVVGGESSRHEDDSGAAPDVGVPLTGQFSPDLTIILEAVFDEGARKQVEDEGTEADDESEIISVGRLLSISAGCESEGVTFEEAIGRAVLILETDTTLDTAGLPICSFSKF